jgi:hypothetical protein
MHTNFRSSSEGRREAWRERNEMAVSYVAQSLDSTQVLVRLYTGRTQSVQS